MRHRVHIDHDLRIAAAGRRDDNALRSGAGRPRVALQIGRGMTVAQFATALAISENTLKTHLGRIFAKNDRARQADLVMLVSTIASPVMRDAT